MKLSTLARVFATALLSLSLVLAPAPARAHSFSVEPHPFSVDDWFMFCPVGWEFELHVHVGQEPHAPLEPPHIVSPFVVHIDSYSAHLQAFHDHSYSLACMEERCNYTYTFFPATIDEGPYDPSVELYRVAVEGYPLTPPFADMIDHSTSKCQPYSP